MLGRASDANGKAYWMRHMSNGMSRLNVLVGFVNSTEFDRICRDFGITKGSVPAPPNTMRGNTMPAKIWNMIVNADVRGISDRPEHIAGIVGNLRAEAGSGLCPFQIQVSNQRGLGLMQWTNSSPCGTLGRRTDLEAFMWRSGISQEEFEAERDKHLTWYCSSPGCIHPPDLLERVLQVQINFMFHELSNTWECFYFNYMDFPTNRTGVEGARSYAELFCALSLRPGLGNINGNDDIQDIGVQDALRASPINDQGRISFSALAFRRNQAEVYYRQFLAGQ
jgi:hypothetical protein